MSTRHPHLRPCPPDQLLSTRPAFLSIWPHLMTTRPLHLRPCPPDQQFYPPDLHFCPASDLHISWPPDLYIPAHAHQTNISITRLTLLSIGPPHLWPPDLYTSFLLMSIFLSISPPHLYPPRPHLHICPPIFHISAHLASTSLTSFPSDLHIFTGLTYTFLYIWLHLPHPSRAPHLCTTDRLHISDIISTHLTSTLLATWPQYFKPIHLTFTDISTHLTSTFLSILVTTNFHIHSALPTCSKSLIMQPPLLADSSHTRPPRLYSALSTQNSDFHIFTRPTRPSHFKSPNHISFSVTSISVRQSLSQSSPLY